MKNIIKKKEFTISLLIVFLAIGISVVNNAFLSLGNFIDMAKGNAMLGTMALGMLPVLITGGIDLSITANITLNSVILGFLLKNSGLPFPLMILIVILVGLLFGLVNGLIISKFEIPPIVTTLGTNSIVMGFVMYFTDGNMITGLPTWFEKFGSFELLGIPVQVIIFVALLLITHFILRYTLIGRAVYAIGGSEISARRIGYNITKSKIYVYVYSGIMAAVAAIINTSILQSTNPNTYFGVDMTVISIAVIGGASTLGGVGTALGTLLGTILMAFVNNGLILTKVPTFWQKIVMGAIIIAAVSIDVINVRKEKSKLVRVDVED